MGKVYFVDGKELELSKRDTDNFLSRMREGGVRMVMTRDTDPAMFLVISHCPIARLVMDEKHTPLPLNIPVEKAPETTPDEPVREGGAEKEQRILADIIEKSNCQHPEEKLIYYKLEGKKGTRYFPVCSFCGWRGKFVAADSISLPIRDAALLFQED